MIAIRKFGKEDAEELSRLIIKALTEVNSRDYPESAIRFLCGRYSPKLLIEKSKEREMFVAVDGGRVVGTASLLGNTIRTVFVDTKFHKEGIGTRLIRHLEGVARKKGYKSIEVPSTTTACGFYEKLGYKRIRDKHEENVGTLVLMAKELPAIFPSRAGTASRP